VAQLFPRKWESYWSVESALLKQVIQPRQSQTSFPPVPTIRLDKPTMMNWCSRTKPAAAKALVSFFLLRENAPVHEAEHCSIPLIFRSEETLCNGEVRRVISSTAAALVQRA
jgi:hypothetical protein